MRVDDAYFQGTCHRITNSSNLHGTRILVISCLALKWPRPINYLLIHIGREPGTLNSLSELRATFIQPNSLVLLSWKVPVNYTTRSVLLEFRLRALAEQILTILNVDLLPSFRAAHLQSKALLSPVKLQWRRPSGSPPQGSNVDARSRTPVKRKPGFVSEQLYGGDVSHLNTACMLHDGRGDLRDQNLELEPDNVPLGGQEFCANWAASNAAGTSESFVREAHSWFFQFSFVSNVCLLGNLGDDTL